jgi:hypothetical protein
MRLPPFVPATLVAVACGVLLAPGGASARNCKDELRANSYTCKAVSNAGEQFAMGFAFTGTEGDLFLRVNGGAIGACSCKAKKANANKPDKIKFDAKKDFHCLVAGGDFTGPESGGPEFGTPGTFLVDLASYEGKVKKKAIKKGEAVDGLGRSIVYNCDQD